MLTQFFSQKLLSLSGKDGRLGITASAGANGPIWCCEAIPNDIAGGILGLVRWLAGDSVADQFDGAAKEGESLSDFIQLEDRTLDILGLASMQINTFRLAIERQPVAGEHRSSKSTFNLAFVGELSISDWVRLEGALVFQIKPNVPTAIQFQLDANSQFPPLEVPVPGYSDLVLQSFVSAMDLVREVNNGGHVLALIAEGSLSITGGPHWLPEEELTNKAFNLTLASMTDINGTTNLQLSLNIPDVMEDVSLEIPDLPNLITLPGMPELKLGVVNVLLSNLSVVLESKTGFQPYLTFDCGVGLPAELNKLTGTDANAKAILDWVQIFDPKRPNETRITGQLAIKPEGIEYQLLTSPIKGIQTQPKSNVPGNQEGNTWVIDLKKEGLIHLDPPVLFRSNTSQAIAARGGFHILRPLKIALAPFHQLIDDLLFTGASSQLPAYLEFKDIELLKERKLNAEVLGQLWGQTLPGGLQVLLDQLSGFVPYLPSRLKSFLNCSIPERLHYNFRMNADGSAMGGVLLSEDQPLRFLLPVGLGLLGIELRQASLGQLNGGKLGLLELDLTVDYFFLPEIIASMALSKARTPLIPHSSTLYTHLELKKVMAVINFQSGTVMPMFYDKIEVGRLGAEGFELASQFQLPKPTPDILNMVSLAATLVDFLTLPVEKPNGLLDQKTIPEVLETYFEISHQYLKTPDYIGKQLLGSEAPVLKVDAEDLWPHVAHTFNFLKTGQIDEFVQSFPIEYRLGTNTLNFFGMEGINLSWVVSAPEEFETSAFSKLNLKQSEVAPTLALLPKDQDSNRLVALLHGEVALSKAASLSSTFGFSGGFQGASTGFRLKGSLIEGLIGVELCGEVGLVTNPAAFNLEGSSTLSAGGVPVLSGTVGLKDGQLYVSGALNLFPDSKHLSLCSDIEGVFSSDGISISGSTELKVQGATVLKGTVLLTESSLTVSGVFLGVFEGEVFFSKGSAFEGSLRINHEISLITEEIVIFGQSLCDPMEIDLDLYVVMAISASGDKFSLDIRVTFELLAQSFEVDFSLDFMPRSLDDLSEHLARHMSQTVQDALYDLYNRPEKILEALLSAAMKTLEVETWTASIEGKEGKAGFLGLQSAFVNITALGAYQGGHEIDHLFAYGQVKNARVQLPATHVEGLSLAIACNRRAKLPVPGKVCNFPLIKLLEDGRDIGEKASKQEITKAKNAQNALISKFPWKRGSHTVAAGFKSNRFNFIKTVNVLMVEIGRDTKVRMAGTTAIKLPAERKPIVNLGLAYRSTVHAADGNRQIHGSLNRESYLLTKALRPTGEFVYHSWSKGLHAGDFVISIGGYHPKYKVPAHYPNPRAVELKWDMADAISAKGQMYSAFTPSHMMLGGRLKLTVRLDGKAASRVVEVKEQKLASNFVAEALSDLERLVPEEIKNMTQTTELFEASMDVSFDLLIGWEPMSYHTTIEVGFKAEIKLKQAGTALFSGIDVVKKVVDEIPVVREVWNFFGELVEKTEIKKVYDWVEKEVTKKAKFVASKLLSPNGTLELEIWGSNFGGKAHFHNDLFDFSVALSGAKDSDQGQNMSQLAFEEKYLSKPLLDLSVKKGILDIADEHNGRWYVVDPDQVEVNCQSNLPANKVSLRKWSESGAQVHMAPVGEKAVGVRWDLMMDYAGPVGIGFQGEPFQMRFPKAVWGKKPKPDLSKNALVNLLTGLRVVPEPGKPPGFTEAVDADEFKFQDIVENDPVWQWGTFLIPTYEHQAHANTAILKATLPDKATRQKQQLLADFIHYELNFSMKNTAENPEATFISMPKCVHAAER